MAFDTLITNALIATATDTYTADIGISDGKIVALGSQLPRERARKLLDSTSGAQRAKGARELGLLEG